MGCEQCCGNKNKPKLVQKDEIISLTGILQLIKLVKNKSEQNNSFVGSNPKRLSSHSNIHIKIDIPNDENCQDIKQDQSTNRLQNPTLIQVNRKDPDSQSTDDEDEKLSDELLIDDKFIRDDERKHIRFSKLGIITFINSLVTDVNWELLYNENDITLFISKDGSPLSKEFLMAKSSLIIKKKDYRKKLTIDFLYNLVRI